MNSQAGPWRIRMLQRLLPWDKQPVRPAEVVDALFSAMFDRKNIVEDANYLKYAPNHFVVELSEANYLRNYQPIEKRIVQQWQGRVQEHLLTTNSRQGRLEYRLGGPLKIELRPAAGLREDQARVLCCLDPYAGSQEQETPACLELLDNNQRYRLREGIAVIGRDPSCEIRLDTPEIISKRLVGSRHAYIVCDAERCRLFDGDLSGKPSVNGTYVNHLPVPPEGYDLQEGDVIILAALAPGQPRSDTPGVAVLRFLRNCR